MKYAFIRDQSKRFPISALCRVLQVSRSGFHAWLTRPESPHQIEDRQLLVSIRRIHTEHREA